ncbi:MAG: iron complex outermembrane receptor protein [Alphaproteobacteria bacterium]|jgi:iron complex outermembrane receptor protein
MSLSTRTGTKNPQKLTRTPVSTAVQAATTAMLIGALPSVASAQLDEIVVTASKRSENLQDVAVSVVALDSQTLTDVGITNFDDFVRQVPTLTAGGRGPGNTTYYIRGMATRSTTLSAVEAVGNSPNVALYLDEQPIQTIGRNLDVYISDMERIEVLAGPQGTLFGASSQAGTVRLITKKPVLDEFQSGAKFSISDTKSGEMSTAVEAYINIPLLDDKLAWRTVVYSSNQGGFIDNVQATYDPLALNASAPQNIPHTLDDNTQLAADDYNDADYQGVRSALKFQANDNWDFLLQVMAQEMNATGSFAMDPTVGDLQVTKFFPDFNNDEFSQVAWTANGQIGDLEVIYTGAYLDREVHQSTADASAVEDGPFAWGYVCDAFIAMRCYDPSYGVQFRIETERSTHELRVATSAENKLRFIGGVFFDDADLGASVDFQAPGQVERGVTAQQEIFTDQTAFDPTPRPPGVNFVSDITRFEKQTAVFGELSYSFTDALTASVGARYFEQEYGLAGGSNFFFEAIPRAWNGYTSNNGANTPFSSGDTGQNIDVNLAGLTPGQEDDTIIKVNVSWTPNGDSLLYATYSEGYRPGGFNRQGGPSLDPTIDIPFSYISDAVENVEFGWKMSLLDNRLRWNGTVYSVEWNDVQLQVADTDLTNLLFTTNIGAAEVKGIDSDIAFAATDNFTLFLSFAWNDSELTSLSNDVFTAENIVPVGSTLAFAPEFSYNLRGRYTYELGDYEGHVQLALNHVDDSKNSIFLDNLADIPSYDTWYATIGFNKENYGFELFLDNITDERVIRFVRTNGPTDDWFVTRPRSIGLRFRYDY